MMKMILTLCILLFTNQNSFAGISTNGGNLTSDQNNVWYLGDKPVRYCIENHPRFPLNLKESQALVRESIDDWIQFFKKYGLDKMSFDDLKNHGSAKLSLNFIEVPCDNDPELLRFQLGTDQPSIKESLSIDSRQNALAMSIRKDYNHETYRNGGIVWIRNWSFNKAEAKHLLLHELGHVFGMQHDSIHVMDSQVADNIRIRKNSKFLGMIESPTWIYRLNPKDTIDFTANGRVKGNLEPNFLLLLLRDVFGFERENNHSLSLHVESAEGPYPSWNLKVELTEDETGKKVEMQGNFMQVVVAGSKIAGSQGPTLYTEWQCTNCKENGRHFQKHLDTRPSGLEATGSFTYKGVTYPAILENRKGILLRIFITGKNLWWTNQNYFGCTAALI